MQQFEFRRLLDSLDAGRCDRQDAGCQWRWTAARVALTSPALNFATDLTHNNESIPERLASAYATYLSGESRQPQVSMTWLMEEFNAALLLLSQAQSSDRGSSSAIRRRYLKRCHPDVLPTQLRSEANRLLAEINIRTELALDQRNNMGPQE